MSANIAHLPRSKPACPRNHPTRAVASRGLAFHYACCLTPSPQLLYRPFLDPLKTHMIRHYSDQKPGARGRGRPRKIPKIDDGSSIATPSMRWHEMMPSPQQQQQQQLAIQQHLQQMPSPSQQMPSPSQQMPSPSQQPPNLQRQQQQQQHSPQQWPPAPPRQQTIPPGFGSPTQLQQPPRQQAMPAGFDSSTLLQHHSPRQGGLHAAGVGPAVNASSSGCFAPDSLASLAARRSSAVGANLGQAFGAASDGMPAVSQTSVPVGASPSGATFGWGAPPATALAPAPPCLASVPTSASMPPSQTPLPTLPPQGMLSASAAANAADVLFSHIAPK